MDKCVVQPVALATLFGGFEARKPGFISLFSKTLTQMRAETNRNDTAEIQI